MLGHTQLRHSFPPSASPTHSYLCYIFALHSSRFLSSQLTRIDKTELRLQSDKTKMTEENEDSSDPTYHYPPPPRYYPPCPHARPEERRLYQRLKRIFEKDGHTFDEESKSAWFVIIRKATMAPSTIDKITNHKISRMLDSAPVTWAHVVVLRVMFDDGIFRSKKIWNMMSNKYPGANFRKNVFHEDYRKPGQSEILSHEVQGSTNRTLSPTDSHRTHNNSVAGVRVPSSEYESHRGRPIIKHESGCSGSHDQNIDAVPEHASNQQPQGRNDECASHPPASTNAAIQNESNMATCPLSLGTPSVSKSTASSDGVDVGNGTTKVKSAKELPKRGRKRAGSHLQIQNPIKRLTDDLLKCQKDLRALERHVADQAEKIHRLERALSS